MCVGFNIALTLCDQERERRRQEREERYGVAEELLGQRRMDG